MKKIRQDEFLRLVAYMKQNYGINLEKKLALVEGRLWSVIQQKGFESLHDYFEHVMGDKTGVEAKTLITRLTTNYTYFMREEQHYRFLVSTVLPPLLRNSRERDLRIWSAGCSSGEEPYTIAMVIDNHFGGNKQGWDTKILATDISPPVLDMARKGVYPEERLQKLSPAFRTKYFKKAGESEYEVIDKIKNEVILRPFNLMEKTLPFRRKFHVIFCRNVMIYFDWETREALIDRFYDALEPGGYLFIGLSETISKANIRFKFIQPSIYWKEG